MKLSACLVIRNEAKLLDRCLGSLKGLTGDIIIVHDGKCTDNSLEIARNYKARIYEKEFVGEAEYHRPFTFKQAKGEWILQIDADEFLSEITASAIPGLLESADCDAYYFTWPYVSDSGYITKGPFSKTFKPALFRKNRLFMIGVSHEYPRTYGKKCNQEYLIEHKPQYDNFSFKTFSLKWTKWARIQASQLKNLEAMPVFNISNRNLNPEYKQLKRTADHPIATGIRETLKFIYIYFSRGLLTAGLKSWKIAALELSYIWVLRFYLITK